MRGKITTALALVAPGLLGVLVANGAVPAPVESFAGTGCPVPGDGDASDDGFVELEDTLHWQSCSTGPVPAALPPVCCPLDFEANATVDLADFASFQNGFGACTADRFLNRCTDDCSDALPLAGESLVAFNNTTATLDGPEHTECVFFMEGQIDRDVWGCWTSPCTGTVFVSACYLTEVDTKIAVYEGCACPVSDARLATCDDDACDVQSVASFEATSGQSYLIRLGVFPDTAGGSGSIAITCGLKACPGTGDCFTANPSPGCSDEACCESVCTADPLCCQFEWDSTCADEASGFCGAGFTACGPGAGSCTDPLGNGTPGCDDVDCCDAVCRADSYCCGAGGVGEWDDLCAEAEAAICHTTCGPRSGSCFDNLCIGGENPGTVCETSDQCLGGNCGGNGTAGCELEPCCAEVCPRDPFCCQVEWDGTCIDLARELCINTP